MIVGRIDRRRLRDINLILPGTGRRPAVAIVRDRPGDLRLLTANAVAGGVMLDTTRSGDARPETEIGVAEIACFVVALAVSNT